MQIIALWFHIVFLTMFFIMSYISVFWVVQEIKHIDTFIVNLQKIMESEQNLYQITKFIEHVQNRKVLRNDSYHRLFRDYCLGIVMLPGISAQ